MTTYTGNFSISVSGPTANTDGNPVDLDVDTLHTGGDEVTISAPVHEGYDCIGWYDGDTLVSEESEWTFTLTGSTTLVAKYEWNGFVYSEQDGGSVITGVVSAAAAQTLETVTIPDFVIGINSGVFDSAVNLTAIDVAEDNTVFSSDGGILYDKEQTSIVHVPKKLAGSVTLPDGLQSIKGSAFSGRTLVAAVTIPDTVTSIGSYAFRDCAAEITWAGAPVIIEIGNYAFAGYDGTALTVPNSVTSIGNYAFDGCTSLTSITIPADVTNIGSYAFRDCTAEITWAGTPVITEIGSYAFAGYDGTALIVPSSVTSIANDAFSACGSLESLTVAAGNPVYHSAGNCIIETATNTLVAGCKSSVIPTDGNVISIGEGAFSNCTSLTSIVIPDNVTSIGLGAFEGCASLSSITIPFIGENANGTGAVHFSYIFGASESNQKYNYTEEHVPESLKTVVITGGEDVTDYAFSYCRGLTSITIPDSVTSIGRSAFLGCRGLTSITIPDSVTSIGRSAFEGCSGLTYVRIPDGVTSIGDYAFLNCSGLTSVTIPDSVTSIGNSAFSGCSGLTYVRIPDGVTSIGDSAFRGCTRLSSVTIPDSVTSIGDWAFQGCSRLTSITIPDSVTSIGDSAFRGCTSLTAVTISASVTNIGSYAFFSCSRLTSVTFGVRTGWYVTEDSTATSGTSLSSSSLSNKSTAAAWLTSTYALYYWKRNA